jgi:hypothetical protein
MKKNLQLIVLLFVLLTAAGCKKCYYCHNSCKVCQDAHFYILVQSDVLSTAYYDTYIDSLTGPGLGWTCRDTTFTKEMQVCAPSGNQINQIGYKISQDEAAGYTCSPINN